MSMIGLAQRLRPVRRGLGHSLLLLICVTAAIIIGLLAMHSFNSHTDSDTHAETSAVVMHDVGAGAHVGTEPATDGDCGDCGGHTSMLAMTCVLALLAVSLLILLRRVLTPWGPLLRAEPVEWVRATLLPRPPSLLVLCISRT